MRVKKVPGVWLEVREASPQFLADMNKLSMELLEQGNWAPRSMAAGGGHWVGHIPSAAWKTVDALIRKHRKEP